MRSEIYDGIEEMATMLSIQLDLRREAEHLKRFNNNFKNNDVILFPKVCTFCLRHLFIVFDELRHAQRDKYPILTARWGLQTN